MQTIIIILILLVVFVLLVAIFLLPSGLVQKAAERSGIILTYLPGVEEPEPAGEVEVEEEVSGKFESLVATFREYKDYEGPCFVRYDDLGDLDENRIELTYLLGEDALVMKLIAEDGRTYATERIEGLQPCVVAGREEMAHEGREVVAENFYYNWIEPGVNRRERRPDFYRTGRVVLSSTSARVLGIGSGNPRISWDGVSRVQRYDHGLLYKADKKHLCFFTGWDLSLLGVDVIPDKDYDEDGLHRSNVAKLNEKPEFFCDYLTWR